jgi:hypothetical protein
MLYSTGEGGVTKRRDLHGHASTLVHQLHSDATHVSITHVMVGVIVMMDRERLGIHGIVPVFWWDGIIPIFWWDSDGIIPSGQGVVNQKADLNLASG